MSNKILVKRGNSIPTASNLDRYELGFAESNNGLYTKNGEDEIVHLNPVAEQVDLKTFLLNTVYPVGTVYFTNDKMFNPNTVWGGTWENVSGSYLYLGEENVGEMLGDINNPINIQDHILTEANLANHTHSLGNINISNESAGTPEGNITGFSDTSHMHNFSGKTGSSGYHTHTAGGRSVYSGGGTYIAICNRTNASTEYDKIAGGSGDHIHEFSGATDLNGSMVYGSDFDFSGEQLPEHTHTVNGSVNSTGQGAEIEHEIEVNLPRFITLAWRRIA